MKTYLVVAHQAAEGETSLVTVVTPSGYVEDRRITTLTMGVILRPGYAIDLIARMFPAVAHRVHGDRLISTTYLDANDTIAAVVVTAVDVED